ncbi:tetratricopeptide repeat protein 21B-like [Zerene cesonia]|uniref:tetratricopeptide repeat protein 21B-like n=1 Tax=Zerene cesonia TaxID=33412 RepID=UPI0018E55CB4|nr:tetratricopeptide repeat protein 21B-like [Zerene cesonia]XP_038223245.1 tetratricopeptide repeat protein 21B-like [Zerene cesonia]
MENIWHRCNIHYYIREKCFGKAKEIAKHASLQFNDSSEFLFYHGLANILEGQVQTGIQELSQLQSDKDVQLAVVMALIYSYKLVNTIERDELHNLEAKLKEERKYASATSLYFAGLFLSFAEKYEKAADYINKSLRKDPNHSEALILKASNDIHINLDMHNSIIDCLELVLSKNDKNIEALLALAKLKYMVKKHEESNLTLDKLIVHHPRQVVPLIEKLKNEFAAQKWESVYDTIERVLSLEPTNIEALKIRIFIALCKNSDYIEAVDQLNTLFNILENEESNNAYQFYNIAQTFSKVCGRSSTVISQVYRFAQYASEMYSNNVDYLSEVGYQCILQGKYKDALNFFKAASKIDSNSITALCGLTLCQMYDNGPTEQVAQQVELLFEMQGNDKFPILYLLSAKLNSKNANAKTFLNQAFESQLLHANQYPFSLLYIQHLDPDFLLEVYKEYKKHLPKKPFVITSYLLYTQDDRDTSAETCLNILNIICNACPGLIPALFELAKLRFLSGQALEAEKLALQIGELDNTHAGSQILLTQIYIQQQQYAKASQCLEMCLSYNFKVRDSAMYHFLNGVILKNTNQLQDALSFFSTSVQILNSKNNIGSNKQIDADLNIIDKATLYFQVIELQTALSRFGEAGKTMQEAIQEFSYTSEENRLLIARADIALKKGDIDNAIDTLNDVKPGQPYYFQAHSKMAHIYLKEKKDRTMFTNCFKDIVSNHPMADAHTMMGDAFMSIFEPIQAAESYEAALKGNPKEIQLVKKLGAALVKMHEYDKAIQHYENAIKLTNVDELRFEHLELLIKLKQYDKVDSVISSELNQPSNKEKDTATLKKRINLLLVQARSRELKNPVTTNTNLILAEAKDLQNAVLKRVEIDSKGDIQEEKEKMSSILCLLAKVKAHKEPGVATNLLSEALIYSPRNSETLLALAKLYAQMNNPEKCEQTCQILLNSDPNNESAAVMMADLAFRKVDLETAQRHLSQTLSVKPNSWEALAQLIEVQWRRGSLAEVEPAMERSREAIGKTEDLGYSYCEGLYSAYQGKVNAALRQLNAARCSARWAPAAARRMVLLCLAQHAHDALREDDTRILALRTAEKLLLEVSPSERKGLQALLQLASKQKSHAERVLQELLPTVSEEGAHDDPYVILAIANAYNIVKQPTRAKNILKRTISSIPWTPENADGLEKCWLEVADNQINSGRTDAAKELLTKVLTHNKSCVLAYQYLGYLSEKEQSYKSAAHNYEHAWVHSAKTDLAIGYKLSYAYLKLKKFPECIVVCRHILKIHPEYPKIKKEILEKAKTNLRT